MTRAVIYLRVSTSEQGRSGLGLEAQRRACRAWCKARGYDVAGVCVDELSGRVAFHRRPGLAEALALLSRGSVLVASQRDRFARDVYAAAILEAECRRVGAVLETPDEPASDEPFAIVRRGMRDVVSSWERAAIAQRTRDALAAKRARGEKTGGSTPFGYELAADGRTLVDQVDEQAVIRRIVRMRANRMSKRRIAERLNAEAVPCRGSRWHATTVARILARRDSL